jgi:hypothetical protein
MKRTLGLVLLAGGALAVAAPANAEIAYAMLGTASNGTGLAVFDTNNPGGITNVGNFSGALPNQIITAIDFRPANGVLYAVGLDVSGQVPPGSAGQLYTVDLTTAALTPVGAGFALDGNSSIVSIDFNPTVDRLRIISGGGQSYRVNPNTGALVLRDSDLAYAAGDPNFGATPAPIGAAYTNNFAGATSTTLFVWDFNNDRLSTVIPPNAGQLNTVGGPAGFLTNDGAVGFDISSATGTAFFSFNDFGGGGELLGTVDLTTGLVTNIGGFAAGFNVADISVVIPAPGAAAAFGLLALGAARRRR